jgi:hypothetical protein
MKHPINDDPSRSYTAVAYLYDLKFYLLKKDETELGNILA